MDKQSTENPTDYQSPEKKARLGFQSSEREVIMTEDNATEAASAALEEQDATATTVKASGLGIPQPRTSSATDRCTLTTIANSSSDADRLSSSKALSSKDTEKPTEDSTLSFDMDTIDISSLPSLLFPSIFGKESFKSKPVQSMGTAPCCQLTHFMVVSEWVHRQVAEGAILGWKGLQCWVRVTQVPAEYCAPGAACLYQNCIAMTSCKSLTLKMFDLSEGKWLRSTDVNSSSFSCSIAEVNGHLMRFDQNTAEVLKSAPGSQVPKRSHLNRDLVSCSVAAEGSKVIIVGRKKLTSNRAREPLHVILYDQTTSKTVDAPFSPLFDIDMSVYMTAPKYVGVIQGAHGFLLNDGQLLRFQLEGDEVKQCKTLLVKEMKIRRLIGTFWENNEVTIIGGREEDLHKDVYCRHSLTTDFKQTKRDRFPILQYDTNVHGTFHIPRRPGQNHVQKN